MAICSASRGYHDQGWPISSGSVHREPIVAYQIQGSWLVRPFGIHRMFAVVPVPFALDQLL